MSVEGGTTTVYIGNYFEWKGSTSTMVRYYYAGAERVAMRTGAADPLWLVGDHLGSTSVAANYDGSAGPRQGYKAWGEKRFPAGASLLPTTFRYTGQREDSYIKLYWYGSRWYDPELSRWNQPDQIIPEPEKSADWDRYSYVRNNPTRYNDPSGHVPCDSCMGGAGGGSLIPDMVWGIGMLNDAAMMRSSAEVEVCYADFSGLQSRVEEGVKTVRDEWDELEKKLGLNDQKIKRTTKGGGQTNDVAAAETSTKTYESIIDKLTRYSLNMDHPIGKDKAVWFEKALGFTKDNADALAKQISFDPRTAYIRGTNQWGTLYNQKIAVTGANGKVITVTACWIILEDGTIKFSNLLPP
jgi:RHS repeat-associated protein